MNGYAIVTVEGNTIILQAKDIEEAEQKFRRTYKETAKSIKFTGDSETIPTLDLSFLSYRSDISTSKMWITKDFEIVPLPGMFHRDFLLNNENRIKFTIEIPDEILVATTKEPERDTPIRLCALKQGFTRVNYQFNGGKITFETHEMTQRMNRKRLLSAIDEIMTANRRLIDEFHLHIVNDEGLAVEQIHLTTKDLDIQEIENRLS